jgi:hypothetical protein
MEKLFGGKLYCSGSGTTLQCGDNLKTNPSDFDCKDGATLKKICEDGSSFITDTVDQVTNP